MNQTEKTSFQAERILILTNEENTWAKELSAELVERGANVQIRSATNAVTGRAKSLFTKGASRFFRKIGAQITATETFIDVDPELDLDIVIATSPLSFKALRLTITNDPPLRIALITELFTDISWPNKTIDAIIAPTKELLEKNAPKELLESAQCLAGPPLKPNWPKSINSAEQKEKLGIQDGKKLALIDATTFSLGELNALLRSISLYRSNFSIAFYVGKDAKRRRVIRAVASRESLDALLLSKVEGIEHFFTAADLVLVGPDPEAILLYIALERPIVIIEKKPKISKMFPEIVRIKLPTDAAIALERFNAGEIHAITTLKEKLGVENIAEQIALLWQKREKIRAEPEEPKKPDTKIEPEPESDEKFHLDGIERIGASKKDISPRDYQRDREADMKLMTSLISKEREIERLLLQLSEKRDLWIRRTSLAEKDEDEELQKYALEQVDETTSEIQNKNHELTVIAVQKEELRVRTAKQKPIEQAKNDEHEKNENKNEKKPPIEDRFKSLEKKDALSNIKTRSRDKK